MALCPAGAVVAVATWVRRDPEFVTFSADSEILQQRHQQGKNRHLGSDPAAATPYATPSVSYDKEIRLLQGQVASLTQVVQSLQNLEVDRRLAELEVCEKKRVETTKPSVMSDGAKPAAPLSGDQGQASV